MSKKLHYGQRSRIRISSSLYDRETCTAIADCYLDWYSALHTVVILTRETIFQSVHVISVVNTRTITLKGAVSSRHLASTIQILECAPLCFI